MTTKKKASKKVSKKKATKKVVKKKTAKKVVKKASKKKASKLPRKNKKTNKDYKIENDSTVPQNMTSGCEDAAAAPTEDLSSLDESVEDFSL